MILLIVPRGEQDFHPEMQGHSPEIPRVKRDEDVCSPVNRDYHILTDTTRADFRGSGLTPFDLSRSVWPPLIRPLFTAGPEVPKRLPHCPTHIYSVAPAFPVR